MSIDRSILSEFIKATNDNKETKQTQLYGTVVTQGNSKCVKIDGSEIVTPVRSITDIKDDERVMVSIKDHMATVTGNMSNPSVGNDRVESAEGKIDRFDHLFAGNITADNIAAGSITTDKLLAGSITTDKLMAECITSDKISANSIESKHIKTNVIEAEHIKAGVINAEHITSGTITADKIQSGTITADKIQSGTITAGSGIIADGAIGSAQISKIDAAKIEAGTIDTSKVTIQGSNGHLRLKGNRMQVFDGVGTQAKERVSVGDINGDGSIFGLRVRGADGQTILLDENGVKSEGITDGSITNDKISEDANIDGAKLNINSVVSKINEDGTETIQGTKIEVDGTNLNTKLSSITIKQDENGEKITQAQSQITANTNAIKLKVDEQTYITDKKDMTSKLEKNTSEISTMKGQIALKVEHTDIENAKSELEGAMDSKINSAKAEIKVTTDAISQNVSNLSQTVSTKADGSTVTTLSNKVGSLETGVNGISGKVTSLEKTTTTLGTQISDTQDIANSAVNKANTAQSTANTANSTANANKGNITTLQGEVSTVKSNVASLDVNLQGITSRVGEVETNQTSINGQVTGLESRMSDAESKITESAITNVVKESQFIKDMNGNITVNKNNISKIEQTSNSITSSVKDLEGKYTEIKQTVDGIDLTGKVSFSDLSTRGRTTINGANITTGTIDTTRVNIKGSTTKKIVIANDNYCVYDGTETDVNRKVFMGFRTNTATNVPSVMLGYNGINPNVDGAVVSGGTYTTYSHYPNNSNPEGVNLSYGALAFKYGAQHYQFSTLNMYQNGDVDLKSGAGMYFRPNLRSRGNHVFAISDVDVGCRVPFKCTSTIFTNGDITTDRNVHAYGNISASGSMSCVNFMPSNIDIGSSVSMNSNGLWTSGKVTAQIIHCDAYRYTNGTAAFGKSSYNNNMLNGVNWDWQYYNLVNVKVYPVAVSLPTIDEPTIQTVRETQKDTLSQIKFPEARELSIEESAPSIDISDVTNKEEITTNGDVDLIKLVYLLVKDVQTLKQENKIIKSELKELQSK